MGRTRDAVRPDARARVFNYPPKSLPAAAQARRMRTRRHPRHGADAGNRAHAPRAPRGRRLRHAREFKGRAPIVRNGLTIPVTASDFDNPNLKGDFQGQRVVSRDPHAGRRQSEHSSQRRRLSSSPTTRTACSAHPRTRARRGCPTAPCIIHLLMERGVPRERAEAMVRTRPPEPALAAGAHFMTPSLSASAVSQAPSSRGLSR